MEFKETEKNIAPQGGNMKPERKIPVILSCLVWTEAALVCITSWLFYFAIAQPSDQRFTWVFLPACPEMLVWHNELKPSWVLARVLVYLAVSLLLLLNLLRLRNWARRRFIWLFVLCKIPLIPAQVMMSLLLMSMMEYHPPADYVTVLLIIVIDMLARIWLVLYLLGPNARERFLGGPVGKWEKIENTALCVFSIVTFLLGFLFLRLLLSSIRFA
ncbi:MAG: hypothetical protein WC552_08495 [Candidatus Omnitrophota bacterium]